MSTQFPVTAIDSFSTKSSGDTISESHVNDLQDAVMALETKVGIDSSAVSTTLDYLVKNFISSGRKVWVYADAAPTGWTVYSTAADCVIAVKGGTEGYNQTGGTGTLYGSWTQPSHTLTEAEIPSHYHSMGAIAGNYSYGADLGGAGSTARNTGSTGGGGAHNHGTTYRPYAAVGIIIEKS